MDKSFNRAMEQPQNPVGNDVRPGSPGKDRQPEMKIKTDQHEGSAYRRSSKPRN